MRVALVSSGWQIEEVVSTAGGELRLESVLLLYSLDSWCMMCPNQQEGTEDFEEYFKTIRRGKNTAKAKQWQ